MTLTEIQQRARKALVSLVAQSGGVSGKAQIQQDQIPLLKELFTERFVERSQWHDDGAIVRVDGWHAFDELVPLEDPNRWDRLEPRCTNRSRQTVGSAPTPLEVRIHRSSCVPAGSGQHNHNPHLEPRSLGRRPVVDRRGRQLRPAGSGKQQMEYRFTV